MSNVNLPSDNNDAAHPVTSTSVVGRAQIGSRAAAVAATSYNSKNIKTVESAHVDDQDIAVRSRREYVTLFRKGEEKTTLAILEMCRVVYEAHTTLDIAEFNAFCGDVGYKDTGSTIRKFISIGRVSPRFVTLADRLPASWTSIYMLTQIPAFYFELMVERGKIFKEMKTSEVRKLVEGVRERSRLEDVLVKDPGTQTLKFATAFFTKQSIDAVDWRAMRKAFAELESRLPIRFEVSSAAEREWEKLKDQMYEEAKVIYKKEALRPDLWDFGRDANAASGSSEVSSPNPEPQKLIGTESTRNSDLQ